MDKLSEQSLFEVKAEKVVREKFAANHYHKEAIKELVKQGWRPAEEMESKLKQANEWISVKDRLPENDDEVLVCIGDDVSALQYNPWGGECPNSWFDWNEIPNWGSERVEILGVTHWKPLPKPPTGE